MKLSSKTPTFAFTPEVCTYISQSIHKYLIGSVSSFNSRTVSESSPFVNELNDLHKDLGINNSASMSEIASNTGRVTADHLSKVWSIDKETADRTVKCTTHLKKQDIEGDISHNFFTNNRILQYKQIDTHLFTETFQAKMKCKKTRGYQYCQLFVSDK